MLKLIVEYGTAIAYVAFNTDILFQIIKIYKRKSSADISIPGSLIRWIASLIILAKFASLSDILLVIGQVTFCLSMGTYLSLLIWYRRQRQV